MKNVVNHLMKGRASLVALAALEIFVLLFVASPAALAQSAKLDLSGLDRLAALASNVTNVNLDKDSLQLAAGHVSGKQQKLLQRLKGVYVRDFEFSKPGEYSRSDVEGILRQLRRSGWKSVVSVEDKKSGETTNVCLMSEGGETVGLAVVDAEPKELTVVNLVGPIDLSDMSGLGGNFGIPPVALEHRASTPAGDKSSGKSADEKAGKSD